MCEREPALERLVPSHMLRVQPYGLWAGGVPVSTVMVSAVKAGLLVRDSCPVQMLRMPGHACCR